MHEMRFREADEHRNGFVNAAVLAATGARFVQLVDEIDQPFVIRVQKPGLDGQIVRPFDQWHSASAKEIEFSIITGQV